MTSPPRASERTGDDAELLTVADIPRRPWSSVARDFASKWGRPNGETMPEHLEILGPSGSGKTWALATFLKQRVAVRDSDVVFVATKPADSSILKLGWPIVDNWRKVTQNPQCIYWPRTKAIGQRRKAFQAERITDLLDNLWQPDSNVVLVFDEIAYVEKLSGDLRDTIDMYLREARSQGITLVMGKQRPQGVTREMHAETAWVVTFKPRDRNDTERTAELFGSKKEWIPIIDSLDTSRHEFLMQYRNTGASIISWIDRPLRATSGSDGPTVPRSRRHRRG